MRCIQNILASISLAASVAILGVPAAYAAIPLLPVCSWPVESTGQGILNVATQDTNTTYWFMPIDTSFWSSILIQGTYPYARFFNLSSYNEAGSLLGTIADDQIAPDPGSTNPFATPTASGPRTYTVTVGASGSGPANTLSVGGSRLAFLVYRVIVPDKGLDKSGGVGAPVVSLVGRDGSVHRLQPCPFANRESSIGNMIPVLIASGFSEAAGFLQNVLAATNQRTSITGSCTPTQATAPAAVPFGAAPGTNFFPDPPTAYLQTPNICFPSDEIIVVRGKAFVFPNTYLGGTVFQPAFDSEVQMRYWSMCNNDGVIPYPVIGCQADFETRLDADQFYTYVVSNDPAPPSWLPVEATWLPWGPTNVPVTLIFRSILPENSTVTGDYYPKSVICDKALFIAQGWQACFAAAGMDVAAAP